MPLMPQFGFFELILVAVVALIVVGPKDLPKLMRSVGKLTGQARRLAAEFTSAFDQMAREAEMEEMRAEIESLKKDNVFADAKKSIDDAVNPVGDALRDEAAEVQDAINKPAPNAASNSAAQNTGDRVDSNKADAQDSVAPKSDAPSTAETGPHQKQAASSD